MDIHRPVVSTEKVNLKAHRIVAGAVLLFGLILYFSTIAPTTSFWDCGEFIACSYSMGVPHPPGAPFYLLLGRMFTLFWPLPDIGLRVNSLSALLSAFTVLLTYLVIVRLVRRWRGPEHTTRDKVVLYGSGVVGALAFAASHSFWFNAVEAEVYAISMFFTALVWWLAVRWMDHADHPVSTRYLLLIAYLVGLATGIHLLNVLALSPIVMLIYFQKYRFTWKGFVIALLVSFAAILVVYPGIISMIPKLLQIGIAALAVALLALIGVFVWAVRSRRTTWSMILASVLLVVIGYSTYTTIYIRSNLDPVINENQPDTIERMISYLNREQYGAVGPVEVQEVSPSQLSRLRRQGAVYMPLGSGSVLRFHILERQADFWSYQINYMYVRYLSWQFFYNQLNNPLIAPFLFGLLGMVWHFWRDPKRGFSVALLFLMTGLAIVFYLNQDNPQPRERDYAYVGSYFAFAIWIGVGVAALVEFLEDLLQKKGASLRRGVTYATVGLAFLLVPVVMVAQNYESHSRSGNYVAWDYSRNMLETCEPNALIFTNGDNDTFPLWYLQVVEGIRPDVRVVNLSLLNTNWYIKQLRDKEPQVPISFSDRDIDDRLTGRTDEALLLRYWPKEKRDWSLRTPDGGRIEWTVPATMYIPTGLPGERQGEPNFLRVQDIMILHILEENNWRKPVYFAVTVSQTNFLGLQPYLAMEGLAFRLFPKEVPEINVETMRENLFETYAGHYRNLNNPDVYFLPHIRSLLQNYRSGFLQLAFRDYQEYKRQGGQAPASQIDPEQYDERYEELPPRERALYTLHRMDEVMPPNVVEVTSRDLAVQVGRMYYELGDPESGKQYFEAAYDLAESAEGKLQAAFFYATYAGDTLRADQIIGEVLQDRGDVRTLFNVAAIYDRLGRSGKAGEILDRISERGDLGRDERLDLGSYFFAQQQYARARRIYEQLAQEYPGNGEVLGALISVYEVQQDTAKLLEALQTWLKRNPNDQEALRLLKKYGGQ